MIFLMEYHFWIIVVLVAGFIAASLLNKKAIALSVSLFFLFIGGWMFVGGFVSVGGWEGMGVTITGLVYVAAGLTTILFLCLKIYFSSRKTEL